MYKTIFDIVSMGFFCAITLVLFIGAYNTQQIDLWIVAALGVMILWEVYAHLCDKNGGKNG